MSRATRLKKKREQAVVAASPCKHCEWTAACLPTVDDAVAIQHCVYCGGSQLSFHLVFFGAMERVWVVLPKLLQRTCPRIVAYAERDRFGHYDDYGYGGPPCCLRDSCQKKKREDLARHRLEQERRAKEVRRTQELADSVKKRIPATRGRRVPHLRCGWKKLWGRKSYKPLDEEK